MRATLKGTTPGDLSSVSDNSLGARAFGGAEVTFSAVPRFAVSADLGYLWSQQSPSEGFALDGLGFALSAHWYKIVDGRPSTVDSLILRGCSRSTRVGAAACTLCAALLIGRLVAAGPPDWSRFRGPNGSGISTATNVPVEFGPKKNVIWRRCRRAIRRRSSSATVST